MIKRPREDDHVEPEHDTPKKLRPNIAHEALTPSKPARTPLADNGTPRSILKKTGLFNGTNATPKSTRKLVFETPTKQPPTPIRNADRSARRKSNRRLIEQALNGAESDEEAVQDEDSLAEHILAEPDAVADTPAIPETPIKRGRGRPKGSGKKGRPPKEPSPSQAILSAELSLHEDYFWQNRPGGNKTSNNTLAAQHLLNHDEYFQAVQSLPQSHKLETDHLLQLHSRAFHQWIFELDEGFNICLYGYGSKLAITQKFTAYLYEQLLQREPYTGTKKTPKIVVVNAYTAGTTIKDILSMIASAAIPSNIKTPNQPSVLLDFILDYLSQNPPKHSIPIILNSIDSPFLRKSPMPSMLARLAAHSSINLVCTADTPNFPLLWDVGLKTQYKFLFHDATTFAPYEAEIDIVESVNELLGRSGRRVSGRDGVAFVLRSLPENARSLFKILVMEQLALAFVEDRLSEEEGDLGVPKSKKTGQSKAAVAESSGQGVEYRVLYHKAVGDFVCSSEVGFRTLLKEFHDHQMIESRKDALGTERLWIPFRLEELEGLAEDLAGDAL